MAAELRDRGYSLPEDVTETDRAWLFELLTTCGECGHPTRRGRCPSCEDQRTYSELDVLEDDYSEDSAP